MFNYTIVIILCFIINIEGLRWKSTGYGKNNKNIISLKSTIKGPIIDVHDGKHMIILKDIEVYKYSITIYCYAVGYDNKNIEYTFCKNKICVTINEKHEDQGLKIIEIKDFKGIQIKITFNENEKDYSANYHCEAYDRKNGFSIQSNFIELRDKYYWEQHIVHNPLNEKTIHNKIFRIDDLPIKLSCFTNKTEFPKNRPNWIFQEFNSPVRWSVCPVKLSRSNIKEETTFTNCIKYTAKIWNDGDETIVPRPIDKMRDQWNFYVNNNGEITIFNFITPDAHNISFALMCYIKQNQNVLPINTLVSEFNKDLILKGLQFTHLRSSKTRSSKVPLLHQKVEMPARNKLQLNHFEDLLFAICLNNFSSFAHIYNWYFKGKEIQNDDNFSIDKFKVEFLNEINSEQEGIYSLADRTNQLIFTISAKVYGPPSMVKTNCFPPIKYIWQNSTLSLKCRFIYRPNNFLIKKSSLKIKEESESQYSVTEEIPTINNSENVFFEHDSNITSDHSLTFIASNRYGSFARSSTIYFLPKLESEIKDFPSDFSCIKPCSHSESHKIFCRINKEFYLQKELDVNISWIINGRAPQSVYYQKILAENFLLDPISNNLELKPITSEKQCGKTIKEFRIECQIILSFRDKSISNFFYNSSTDASLQEKLTAIIKFNDSKKFPLLWIMLIILIIINISVIIFVIVKKKFPRNKYKVTFTKEEIPTNGKVNL